MKKVACILLSLMYVISTLHFSIMAEDFIYDDYYSHPFNDVNNESWYAASVEWAYQNNITDGTGNGNFSPDAIITREQICRLFHNFLKIKLTEIYIDMEELEYYTDVDKVSDWAMEDIAFAVSNYIIDSTSTEELTISPKMEVTRAQAAQFLMNFMFSFETDICDHIMTKADCITSEYCEKCEYYEYGVRPLGHEMENGVCNICGRTAKAKSYEQLASALEEKGSYFLYYYYEMITDSSVTEISYYPDYDSEYDHIVLNKYSNNADYNWVSIYIDDVSDTYLFDYGFVSDYNEKTNSNDTIYMLDGTITVSDGSVAINYYYDDYTYPSDIEECVINELNSLLSGSDYLIGELCGLSISDFGF